jgi:membrane protease YdiL (CAAX protease family)
VLPDPEDLQPPAVGPESPIAPRIVALIEVLLCSDFVTQLALQGTLVSLGFHPFVAGTHQLSVTYVVGLSLGDAVLLLTLIFGLMYAHGERPGDLLLGRRPVIGEALLGLPLIFVALGIAIVVLLSVQRFVPSLHTVPDNPLKELLRTPRDAWLFAIVVLVAGGVREEVQRAFLLNRFEQWLGGGTVGVIVTSVGFGAGHLLQGADAALATGLLGAFWAIVYLRRRSCIAPMVSHAGFDLLQIVQFLFAGR